MADFSQFRVLISGAGSIGQRHLKNLRAAGVSVLAFSDPNPDPEFRIDAQSFVDLGNALEGFKPNVVFICSPTKLHVLQAIQAANAGSHLFIEKPLSHNSEGISDLIKIVDEKKLTTMVACNMRFHPGPKKIKELIDSGAIGDIISSRIHAASYLPRWRRKVPYKESYSADPVQGGVLLDCIHEIDLALWYSGSANLTSSNVIPATSIGLEVDGAVDLLLKHESGATSNIHLSFIQHTWRRGCEIIGSEGTIEWELKSPPGILHTEGDPKVRLYDNNGELKDAFPAESDRDQPYIDEITHFLESVIKGVQTMSPVSDGENSLKIALDARKNS